MKNIWTALVPTLIVITAIVYAFIYRPEIIDYLKDNSELIAVVVSSLAFFWLVFGYSQQAKAFNSQLREVKVQNENNKELLKQTKLQTKTDFELLEIGKSKWKQELINSIRPIIVFHNTGKDSNGENKWVATNVGKSPALNLIISCAKTQESEEWNENETILFPVLPQDKSITLNWTTMHGALTATYSDIENNPYSTKCSGNTNKIYKENVYPNLKPTRFEYQLKMEEMN